MESEKVSNLKTRDQLLAAITPEVLGMIWYFQDDDLQSPLFLWLDYLTGGLLYKQKDYISKETKTYNICKFFDQKFHLTLVPKSHQERNKLTEDILSLVSEKADQRKKILTLCIDPSDQAILKKRFTQIKFESVSLT